MTKKKVVIKVHDMNGTNPKCLLCPNFRRQDNRLKALQIAAAAPGFQSLSLKGTDQDVIEVTGDEVDAVELTNQLRKSVGRAKLETVDVVKDKPPPPPPPTPTPLPLLPPPPPYQPCIVMEPEPPCCTIM